MPAKGLLLGLLAPLLAGVSAMPANGFAEAPLPAALRACMLWLKLCNQALRRACPLACMHARHPTLTASGLHASLLLVAQQAALPLSPWWTTAQSLDHQKKAEAAAYPLVAAAGGALAGTPPAPRRALKMRRAFRVDSSARLNSPSSTGCTRSSVGTTGMLSMSMDHACRSLCSGVVSPSDPVSSVSML